MRARTQRTPKHTNTPWQKACILGAFRLLHRSKHRASSRCEQSIIDIRPVVTAAEIMLPSARATRGPLLPIPFRVTEEHRHHANLTWFLRLERFGRFGHLISIFRTWYPNYRVPFCIRMQRFWSRKSAFSGFNLATIELQQKKCSDVSRRLTTVTI